MLESLYFWKGNNGGSPVKKMLLIALAVVLVLSAGGAGAWYYFIKLPAEKAAEEALMRQRQAAEKLQSDISSVTSFYEKSLEGANIIKAINLINEINKSSTDLKYIGIESEAFDCDIKKCRFSYVNRPGTVLTLPEKTFWGKAYKASVNAKKDKKKGKDKSDFGYEGIESKLNGNALQTAYKNKKPLALYPCDEVVSYILTYNSFLKSMSGNKKKTADGEIVIKKMPNSAVTALETQLVSKVKAYGLMAGTWEIQFKGGVVSESTLNLQLVLFKQAYRDAFLIKRIESEHKGIKVSGGLVCKA